MSRRRYNLPVILIFFLILGTGSIFFTRGSNSLDPLPDVKADTLISVPEPVAAVPEPVAVPPAIRNFIGFVEQELDSSHTVGAAYTIVKDGAVVHTGTFGERKRGSGEKVDQYTLFRLASVSKGFTGVLACLLERDGVFSLDDRVVDHYPGFRLKDSVSTTGLTIRHLLSHTSGLVPYAYDNLVEEGQDLPSIVGRLYNVDISAPPGKVYGYQNVLFSMLDPIARRETGVPYQVLLQEKLFKPLGMTHASAGPVDLSRNPNLAYPHVKTSKGYIPLTPNEAYYNVMPAAGVNASISDMSRWLLALLGNEPAILPDTVINTVATPLIYTPLKWRYTRYWKPFKERYYGLGWRIYQYQGRKIVYHGGYIRGYRAEVAFCREENVGIAFLQNSPNGFASRFTPAFFDLLFQ